MEKLYLYSQNDFYDWLTTVHFLQKHQVDKSRYFLPQIQVDHDLKGQN